MEQFFKDPRTAERFRSGPMGPHMQLVSNDLFKDGYTRRSIRYHLRIIDHFGHWLKKRGQTTEDITSDHVRRYVRQRGSIRNGDAGALIHLLRLLRKEGKAPEEPAGELVPVQQMTTEFTRYLQEERALAPSTIATYSDYSKRFLLWRFGSRRIDLSSLRAGDVVKFVQHQSTAVRSEAIKNITTALRSFLTYLRYRGYIAVDLAAVVPRVANWSQSPIPKGLPPEDVRRVVESCDRKTPVGRRDYAILLLLARLGLRAGEIALMSLDDIDWEGGCLTVHGKGGKRHQLPLPADVGKAIAAYLRAGRQQIPTRRLFVCAQAPFRAFKNHGPVSDVVKHALARAGVKSLRRGAHQFRHALACQLLRRGASLVEIGGVLRHESVHTTAIYAKVDFAALTPLAQPWPGGVK
jgi:site-specific recombinase XerD